jgi:integrase
MYAECMDADARIDPVGRVVVGDDKVMQERLGHADIGITLGTYTHTATEQHREAGDRLDKVFGLTKRSR